MTSSQSRSSLTRRRSILRWHSDLTANGSCLTQSTTSHSAPRSCRNWSASQPRSSELVKESQMDFVELHKDGEIATLMLNKGKVNALNGAVLDQLRTHLEALENDREVRAVILTGSGKFFSFGFDVPEFLSFTKEQFAEFVTNFTDLYAYLFLYPKPVVAALNGHAI